MLELVAAYVRDYYKVHFSNDWCYHNITHTERVVQAASMLCDHYYLNEEHRSQVLIAAWFHDIGYHNGAKNHEEAGVKIAQPYLAQFDGVDSDKICQLIRATSMATDPANLEEEIIRDADLHYLGQTTYFDHADLLRKEWVVTQGQVLETVAWYQTNIAFFELHRFFTEFAQHTYGPAKRQNLQSIKKRLQQELERIANQ